MKSFVGGAVVTENLCGLKLQVVRGQKARDLCKKVLYKPADFSYELFCQYRSLDPRRYAEKTGLRFGYPSFILSGPKGSRVEGWLIRVAALEEIIYIESWPWAPSFFIYTSGRKRLISRFLNWFSAESPDLHLVRGGKQS